METIGDGSIEKRWNSKNSGNGRTVEMEWTDRVFCGKLREIEGSATRPRSFLPPLTLLPFRNLVETERRPRRFIRPPPLSFADVTSSLSDARLIREQGNEGASFYPRIYSAEVGKIFLEYRCGDEERMERRRKTPSSLLFRKLVRKLCSLSQ